jgi:alpha-beta hydrolase superfamily lysophospholipase
MHGVISHSLWLAPIAEKLVASGITVVCPDRRGAGANRRDRGDAPDEISLLEDLHEVIRNFEKPGTPLHLAGFCWGSNYLINFLCRYQPDISSLALLAPALFPAAGLRNASLRVDKSSEPTEIPLVPVDAFTSGPAYRRVILPDPLRLERVSPRFNGIMQTFSRMIGVKLLKLPYPVLMILAEDDRITDNQTTAKLFNRLRPQPRQLVYVPGQHGIQFDAPLETADALTTWLNRLDKHSLRNTV